MTIPKNQIKYQTDETAINQGCYWDDTEFKKYKEFAKQFCLQSEGEWIGKGIELFDYQEEDLFKPLLSWKNKKGNYRFKQCNFISNKKVGKTTGLASLAAFRACCYQQQKIYIISATVKQSKVMFDALVGFAEHPALAERWRIVHGNKVITDKTTGSVITILAAKPTISGFNSDLILVDELAEIPKTCEKIVWQKIQYAGSSKPNSQILSITTPSHELDTLAFKFYKKSEKIISGEETEDITTLPVIYGVPQDEAWDDEKNWLKYLPNINKTVSIDFYRQECLRAKNDPLEEISFRIYCLGQYVQNKNQFFDLSKWNECATELPDLTGKPAVIGLDSGKGANDLIGITIMIPYEDKVAIKTKAYLSSTALHKKNKTGQVQYQSWVNEGLLEIIPGDTISYDALERVLDRIYDDYNVKALAYDPAFLSDLEKRFLPKKRLVISTGQYGKVMSPLILDLERRILEGTILHDNHPILNFCIQNTQVLENKYGYLEAVKDSDHKKIDLAISTIIALNALPEAYVATKTWKLPPVISF